MPQALLNTLSGAILSCYGDDSTVQSVMDMGTSLLSTALNKFVISAINQATSQEPMDAVNFPDISAMPQDIAAARNLSVGELIEELSRNQTLSLFSDSSFW